MGFRGQKMKEKICNWFKKYRFEIITITLMVVLGTCMHFVTGIFDNEVVVKILGVIFPVNETSWEHMKMTWYPFLVAGIIISLLRKDRAYFGAFVLGGVLSIALLITGFAFYQSFTIHSVLAIDIPLFMIVIIGCALFSFKMAKKEWVKKGFWYFVCLAVIVTAIIITLTYVHGDGYLFQDNEGLQHHHEH